MASFRDTTLSYIDLETLSTILVHVFQQLYPSFPFIQMLEEIEKNHCVNYYGKKIYISDEKLFLVVVFNSIRIHHDSCNSDFIEIPESIIRKILSNIDIEKRYTAFLLKTLKYIVLKKKDIGALLCEEIICVTQKVALSSLSGFKKYAHDISQIIINYCLRNKQNMKYINWVPFKGIETSDIVNLYPDKHFRDSKEILIKKICYLFRSNVDNKDGECLYKRLIMAYTFEDWKMEIWPLLLPYLKNFDDYG